jgi:hypothetical protein
LSESSSTPSTSENRKWLLVATNDNYTIAKDPTMILLLLLPKTINRLAARRTQRIQNMVDTVVLVLFKITTIDENKDATTIYPLFPNI